MEVRIRESPTVSMAGDKRDGEGVKKIGARSGGRGRFAKTDALCFRGK